MPRTIAQLLGYALMGTVGTAAHYFVLVAGVMGIGMHPVGASTAGAIVGAATNYLLNYRFTFRSTRPHSEASVRFMAVAVIGIVVNAAILDLGVRAGGLHYLPSQVIATLTVLLLGFFANRSWTFSRR